MAFVSVLGITNKDKGKLINKTQDKIQPDVFKRFENLCVNENEWWKNTVIYEVYMRSFMDSDGDGIGDILGIKSKLDYFVKIGIETLWLTPFYPSPMVDFGYDISNFMDIDPVFGTMEDFKSLLRDMKDKGLKLILDFVPNHTSDQHEWFQKSIIKEDPYTDFYVWKSGKEIGSEGNPNNPILMPPNNWKSVFKGSAWEFHPIRKKFYLHQFAKEQPDLNFRNPIVLQEIHAVLDFWFALGVDGFRLDAAPHLLEDALFRDNPKNTSLQNNGDEEDYGFWDNSFTRNVPGNLKIIKSFRSLCNSWTNKTGTQRVLLTEGYLPIEELITYYGTKDDPIAHFSFNFELLNLNSSSNGKDVFKSISNWFDKLPKHCWSNCQIGNHDQPRAASRWGEDYIDIMNMINLLLPGTAVTYYGEEIGMLNADIKWEETVDPAGKNQGPDKFKLLSRDPERTPMQWSNASNAGFTKGPTTWLPINSNYKEINVQKQLETEISHLKVYKELIKARSLEAWKYGDLEMGCLCNSALFGFTRIDSIKSKSGILVVTNFSEEKVLVDATKFHNVPETITVLIITHGINQTHKMKNDPIDSKSITLEKHSGAVFTFTL